MQGSTDNRALFGHPSNSRCPDFSSHYENAADRIYPAWRTIAPDWQQRGAIDEEAESEYMSCDGH